jgi:hypothetical protein
MNKKPLVYLAVAALSLTACLDEKADQPSNPPPSTPKGAVSKVMLLGDDNATAYSCIPVALQALGADGGAIIAESDTVVTLTETGNGTFYDNDSCGGGGTITTATIAADTQNAVVYFESPSQETITINGTVNGVAGTAWSKVLGPPVLTKVGFAQIGTGSCHSVTLSFAQENGALTPISDSQTATVTVTHTSGSGFVGLYAGSDTSCATNLTDGSGVTTVTVPAGQTYFLFRLQAGGSPVTHNFTISYTTSSHGSGSGYTGTMRR